VYRVDKFKKSHTDRLTDIELPWLCSKYKDHSAYLFSPLMCNLHKMVTLTKKTYCDFVAQDNFVKIKH